MFRIDAEMKAKSGKQQKWFHALLSKSSNGKRKSGQKMSPAVMENIEL